MPADSTINDPVKQMRTRSALIYKNTNFRDFVARMNKILDDLSREDKESATLSIRQFAGGEDDVWIGATTRIPSTEPQP